MSDSGRGHKGESGRSSPDVDRPNMAKPLRIVLVGKTGAGKSSSGNTLLGGECFRAATSGSSVTKECWKESAEVAGMLLTVVDTPGLFDTDLPERVLIQEISKCINMTAPGPHAIILVIELGPFTKQEEQSVEKIRAIFGEEANRFTMILFTHGDDITRPIEEHLEEAGEPLQNLLERVGRRYHVFDNTKMEDRKQVLEFLDKLEDMIKANRGENFSNAMFTDAEQKLRQREAELREEYEAKEKKLTSTWLEEKNKLELEMKELRESGENKESKIRELEGLIKRKDRELKEYRRFYQEKCGRVQTEAEKTGLITNISIIMEKLKDLLH